MPQTQEGAANARLLSSQEKKHLWDMAKAPQDTALSEDALGLVYEMQKGINWLRESRKEKPEHRLRSCPHCCPASMDSLLLTFPAHSLVLCLLEKV